MKLLIAGQERQISNVRKTKGLISGGIGCGRAFHPWDNLRSCPKCGSYPWLVGKDGRDYHSGSPYKVICTNKKCNYQSITSDNISVCKDDWNGE